MQATQNGQFGSQKSKDNYQRRQTGSNLSSHSTMVKNITYRVSFIITLLIFRVHQKNCINTLFQLYVVFIRPSTSGFIENHVQSVSVHFCHFWVDIFPACCTKGTQGKLQIAQKKMLQIRELHIWCN